MRMQAKKQRQMSGGDTNNLARFWLAAADSSDDEAGAAAPDTTTTATANADANAKGQAGAKRGRGKAARRGAQAQESRDAPTFDKFPHGYDFPILHTLPVCCVCFAFFFFFFFFFFLERPLLGLSDRFLSPLFALLSIPLTLLTPNSKNSTKHITFTIVRTNQRQQTTNNKFKPPRKSGNGPDYDLGTRQPARAGDVSSGELRQTVQKIRVAFAQPPDDASARRVEH